MLCGGCQFDMVIKFLEEDSANEPQKAHFDRQTVDVPNLDIMSNITGMETGGAIWTLSVISTNSRARRGYCARDESFWDDYSCCYPSSRMDRRCGISWGNGTDVVCRTYLCLT